MKNKAFQDTQNEIILNNIYLPKNLIIKPHNMKSYQKQFGFIYIENDTSLHLTVVSKRVFFLIYDTSPDHIELFLKICLTCKKIEKNTIFITMKIEKSLFINVLFKLFEDILNVKIGSNSFTAYELICAQMYQKELVIGKLDISKESLLKYSKRRTRILERINRVEQDKGFSKIQTYEFFGEKKIYKEIKSLFSKLIKENTKLFNQILKDETVRNRVFQYHSLTLNDVWYFDFTTLEMLNKCPKTELFVIMDLCSRKIVGWKLFPSKEEKSSNVLIQIISEAIKQFGKPKILHSDCDIKNHSDEFNSWAKNNEDIDISITKDMFEKPFFVHGNQVIE